ncbi:ATP-binding protein [Sphingobacterium faecale]|uniref:ATP-binding protein n=1 Tax=Sphingobacterium faecale TaxID=2803775 RepID=A0ABS1R9C6_9SPHI|nr:AAA family ATPase [Sphingobacterium faecale]MBL1411313.1 ATP-binding protein [Sphingobacterium faecale]
MEFKRAIQGFLDNWRGRVDRKPLILRGARQVGKTTLIRDFSKKYKHRIILNLEKPADRRYFENFDNVQDIVEALFLVHEVPSKDISDTILFIDEIQESPAAIQLLRYFYEEMSELHVISAGSLLEFAMQEIPSFPVGRVEFLYLHPLNFQEYLEANSKTNLAGYLNKIPVSKVAHQILMDEFHRFAIIGGMPEIVKADLVTSNLSDLISKYESIWGTYKNDVEKYASNDTERKIIKHIMDTAPLYLDERVKFQGFGNSNYRSREIGESFRTLDNAKIIRLIYPTTDVTPPIRSDIKKSPRLQFLDTGLINYAAGIQSDMLAMKDLSPAYKGALVPHLIVQELISIQFSSTSMPHFWVRDKAQSSAEVDALLVAKGLVIPIEVKSGATGSLKSLHQFLERVDHHFAVRIYGGDLRVEDTVTPNGKPYKLLNLPYYLGTKLPEYIDWFISKVD